jgi:hypothetical protein
MTEAAELLEFVIDLVARTEELVAINNAIAGGIVTDLTVIREAAARSAELGEYLLEGHKLMLEETNPGDATGAMLNTIYDKS